MLSIWCLMVCCMLILLQCGGVHAWTTFLQPPSSVLTTTTATTAKVLSHRSSTGKTMHFFHTNLDVKKIALCSLLSLSLLQAPPVLALESSSGVMVVEDMVMTTTPATTLTQPVSTTTTTQSKAIPISTTTSRGTAGNDKDTDEKTYLNSLQREKAKQEAMKKSKVSRSKDLCERLGRGC